MLDLGQLMTIGGECTTRYYSQLWCEHLPQVQSTLLRDTSCAYENTMWCNVRVCTYVVCVHVCGISNNLSYCYQWTVLYTSQPYTLQVHKSHIHAYMQLEICLTYQWRSTQSRTTIHSGARKHRLINTISERASMPQDIRYAVEQFPAVLCTQPQRPQAEECPHYAATHQLKMWSLPVGDRRAVHDTGSVGSPLQIELT